MTPLRTLAADYGLKARTASGIRGDDLEDWPRLSEPDDLALVRTYFTRLLARSTYSLSTTTWVTAGINSSDPLATPWRPDAHQLLELGEPHLHYSLFERPDPRRLDHLDCLPLRFAGDPRLPRTRDHAWTDLLLIGSNPNLATLDTVGNLQPLTVSHPHRTTERIRWALHSLCRHDRSCCASTDAPPPPATSRHSTASSTSHGNPGCGTPCEAPGCIPSGSSDGNPGRPTRNSPD